MMLFGAINRSLGLSLAGVGVLLLGTAFWMYKDPVQPVNEAAVSKKKADECEMAAKKANFSLIDLESKEKGVFRFIKPGLQQYRESILSASYLISECDAYSMTKFCFGESCEYKEGAPIAGLFLELREDRSLRKENEETDAPSIWPAKPAEPKPETKVAGKSKKPAKP